MSVSKSEAAYIASALLASPTPIRADGRSLIDYRAISVETGVAPAANGSGRALIGSNDDATEVIIAVRLEVEEMNGSGRAGDQLLSCSVTCTPSAYPSHSFPQLDDLSTDLSLILHDALSTSVKTLIAPQLIIIPNAKRWRLSLEAIIIADGGNVLDALVIASRAALWDLRIPRTRGIEYRKTIVQDGGGAMEVEDDAFKSAVGKGVSRNDGTGAGKGNGARKGADFELEDYWDDGIPLTNRESLPVCITLNLLPPSTHFLDATLLEEESVPTKLHLTFSFADPSSCFLQNTRLTGPSEVPMKLLPDLVKAGQDYAFRLAMALDGKLVKEQQ